MITSLSSLGAPRRTARRRGAAEWQAASPTYLGGSGNCTKGPAGVLSAGTHLRRKLACWAEMLQVGVDRLDVAVCHSAKVEPQHRRADFAARELHELVRRHVLHEEAQVGGIRRTPGAPPAELVSGKPQLLFDWWSPAEESATGALGTCS